MNPFGERGGGRGVKLVVSPPMTIDWVLLLLHARG